MSTVTPAAYRIDGQTATREAFYAVACDPAHSVAVEACAGAGKTWMLVSRIARALLDGVAPQDILAITFTKKAAGEMRQRLDEQLRSFSGMSDAERVQALVDRGMSDEQAQRRAPELLTLYSRSVGLGRPVQVRTFHSWFAALLRGAPLSVLQELELPAQYELLEDDQPAVDLVWPRFYIALATDASAYQDFVESAAEIGRFQTQAALKKALQKRIEFSLADRAGKLDDSVDTFGEAYPALAHLAEPQAFFEAASEVPSLWWDAARALGQASAVTFAAKGVELEQALSARSFPGVMNALLTQKREPRKFGERIAGITQVREAQTQALELLSAVNQHQAWQHHQRMTRLSRVLLRCFAELKRERGWVDMNDVETAALRLLGDAELSGWMQQRLDARIRHLLIDEFQDTNPLQWQALYGWLSAYAGAGSGEAPRVFLVGDPKQSIYRFRRAEPQVFRAAQQFVVDGLSGRLLSCDHTRRCAPPVVAVLNQAMLAAVEAGDYSAHYRAHTTESTAPGRVIALPTIARDARDSAGQAQGLEWRDSLNTPLVELEDGYSAREAQQAADWIAAEVDAGRLRADDIMVLARRRERLGWMHEALLARGIPSEQPEKLELAEAPAVQDVIALLDVLVSQRHHLSLARALKSPLFGWSDAMLAQVARLRQHWTERAPEDVSVKLVPLSWWAVLLRFAALPADEQRSVWVEICPAGEAANAAGIAALLETVERLQRYHGWLQTLPPHDALSAIYDDGDVLARFGCAVPSSQRPAVLAQLRDLLTHSLAIEGGRFLTPYRFVRALKAGGIKASASQTPGAVRLLTIHGAKGLEAHTVLLLDTATGSSRPESMGVLVDWPGDDAHPRRFVFLASEKTPPACAVDALQVEQQARSLEELNALYVALTRAESQLVISSFEPHQRGSSPSWHDRLHTLAPEVEAPPVVADLQAQIEPSFELVTLPALTRSARPAPELQTPVVEVSAFTQDDERRRFGLAVHRLLQWYPTLPDRFAWSDTHVHAVAAEFELLAERASEARAMAERMVSAEAAWAWDPERVAEWSNEVVLVHEGEQLRLDRLVRTCDSGGDLATWWVLDFKTATQPQQQVGLLRQMASYRAAVAAAHPGEPLRVAFINADGRLIELPSL
ncbi:UvrD-helicase domain-containing protein [Hydrogenophaga sp.]|uniref:UvrD-helicase domain-containing protein n=1 Tax=Hydrogenophaga sp. TaxID=1904254 RepID=UPI0025C4139B|nr:UvrD-helicase domain-containing protein [Hydrogenophaga sp.]